MAFPEEIILDIISRLPIKSIGRCRCVSKPWNSLLSHPDFIKTQLNRAKQIPRSQASLLLASLHSHAIYTTSLQPSDDDVITTYPTELNLGDHTSPHTKIRKMVSCDGLILITIYTGDKEKLLLVNPTTQEFKELPYLRPYANPLHEVIYGLGYDSVSDDYKIVAISYLTLYPYPKDDPRYNLDYSKMTFVDVYSIKNETWKRLDTSPCYPFETDAIVTVNGYVHWKAYTDDSSVILALALGEDRVSQVPIPSCFNSSRYKNNLGVHRLRLVEVGGCLGVYSDAWNLKREDDPWNLNNCAVVWIMREYGVRESWVKFTIAKGSFIQPIWSLLEPVYVLGMDQLVLLQHDKHSGLGGVNKLVLYNLEQGTIRDIILPGMMDEYKVGVSFIQTLVSPHYNT